MNEKSISKRNDLNKIINDVYGKAPPQAVDIEEVILGALMVDNEGIVKVRGILKPKHFYKEEHQIIYSVILKIFEKGLDVDILVILDALKDLDYLEKIGGFSYITELTSKVANSINIYTHTLIVVQKYMRRFIISICQEAINLAYNEGDEEYDIDEIKELIISKIEDEFDEISMFGSSYKQSVTDAINTIETIFENGVNKDLLLLGWEIDNVIEFYVGQIIYLASAPKHAKTKLTAYMLYSLLCGYNNLSILWYAMEDTTPKIIRNMIAIETGIEDERQMGKRGLKLTGEEMNKIKEAGNKISTLPVKLIDRPTRISSISSNFRTHCKRNKDKINFLVIDNFNICMELEENGKSATEKESYVASFIQNLNASLLSQGYKVIIIVIDHLKKKDKSNLENGYRPQTEDLKGSERKYAIATQLIMLNLLNKHKDLLREETLKGSVSINNKRYSRADILDKLLIIERTDGRDLGSAKGGDILRMVADLGSMKFYNLNEAYKLIKPIE
jgi:replicative DNA helicase